MFIKVSGVQSAQLLIEQTTNINRDRDLSLTLGGSVYSSYSRNATMVMSCVSKLLLEGDVDGEPDAALSLSPFTCTTADQQLNCLREEILISRSMSGI